MKDFRLLVALHEDARQSYRALGRRLSLSAPAVHARMRRLQEGGILQGFWVSIDPAIFGRKDVLVHFRGEWNRDAAVAALDAPDVAWIAWKVDDGITVQVWPVSVKRGVADLSRFLARKPDWRGVAHSEWEGTLNGLDWRALDALIDDPRRSVERLSDATGLSPKTVRKHLRDLTRIGAISIVPRLGFSSDSGGIVCHLLVSGTAPVADVRRVWHDVFLIHETGDPPRKYLFCRADSLGELTARTHALGTLRGVTSVRVTLNRELIIGIPYAHRLVQERIEAWRSSHLPIKKRTEG